MSDKKLLPEVLKLIEVKKKLGLSQDRIGYRIGVTGQTINNWTHGYTVPTTLALKSIREFLALT